MRVAALALAVLLAAPAAADPPVVSGSDAPLAAPVVGTSLAPPATIYPRPRPIGPVVAPPAAPASSQTAVLISPWPKPRSGAVRPSAEPRVAAVVPVAPEQPVRGSRRGSVCSDRSIRGERLADIRSETRGCGIDNPVRVTEVDGVLLSRPATLDCDTASALRRWVTDVVKPNVGRYGGGVASLEVYAHYACRTRNSQSGAQISEHGRGRAIDIGAFNLRDGTVLSVLEGWGDRVEGAILRALHGGACGRFGTVLGPNADRFHRNHLHLDTARHRRGAYCR